MALDTGDDTQVLASLSDWSRMAVTSRGIYFVPIGQAPNQPVPEYPIDFLDFATRKIERIARLEKPLFIGSTVSADERWLLFSQIDQTGADLMMVENFK